MILESDRKLAKLLLDWRIWSIIQPRDDLFRCARIKPRKGTIWLWRQMVKRQTRDGLHHAPCCPGNEWSGAELVVQSCTCGAAR